MMFFYVNFYEKIKLKKQLIEHLQFIIQMFSHKLVIMHNFPFGETSRNWKKKVEPNMVQKFDDECGFYICPLFP
jgi:hypothetical protein